MMFVITAANLDSGGNPLNKWYLKQAKFRKNLLFIPNLGYEFI